MIGWNILIKVNNLNNYFWPTTSIGHSQTAVTGEHDKYYLMFDSEPHRCLCSAVRTGSFSVYPTDHAVDDRLEHSHKSQQPEQLILAN
jgi:hypothetical protein